MEKIAGTEVLVVIVAHRYGWVPKDQQAQQHNSITWLECEQAQRSGMEVLAFLIDDHYDWSEDRREEYEMMTALREGKATGELLQTVQENVASLKKFKEWLNSRAISQRFTSPEDLRGKISDALREWRARTSPVSSRKSVETHGGASSLRPTIPQDYLNWLQRECSGVDLLGLDVKQGLSVTLNNIYVPLTTAYSREKVAEAEILSQRPEEKEEKPQLLLDLLDKESLYLPGTPGSGKSTFCRWIAWLACVGKMPAHPIASPEDHMEHFPESLRERLPLFLKLREFWHWLPRIPGQHELTAKQLESALQEWISEKKPDGLEWANFYAHLEQGSTLLVIDGVDEVPLSYGEGREASSPRNLLLSGLAVAIQSWLKRGNRLLLTSRPYGLSNNQAKRLGLRQAAISVLDKPLQELFVQRWFHALEKPSSMAQSMLRHSSERGDLGELLENPMLLTALCVIYGEGGRLPQDKYDLYTRIIDNVLYNRYPSSKENIDPVRNRLAVIAHGMHTGKGLGEERKSPEAEVSYTEIERMLQAYRQESPETESGMDNAVLTREELLSLTGLLLPRGGNRAAFYHLSFQEFLAAERLLDLELEGEGLYNIYIDRAPLNEWHPTLAFIFGGLLYKFTQPKRAVLLLNRLISSLDPRALDRQYRLAAAITDCLEIALAKGLQLQQELKHNFRGICLAAIEAEVSLGARQKLGLMLGQLGDPRVTDLRNREGYAEIPTGKYVYGDDRSAIRIAEPFLFSRYPVTNSQYKLFMDENGYENPRFWSEAGRHWLNDEKVLEPRYWHDRKWNGPNQPVVGVSFWEAEAFCAWAGGRLPTEQEWEAAARGPEGYEYPWGDKWENGICNGRESGLGVTSPVGLFPRSRSKPFNLEDMAGNVWEWCLTRVDDPDDIRIDQSGRRVVRGGAWDLRPGSLRSASRYRDFPDSWSLDVGFRLAQDLD